jgi:hypothetical protein
VVWARSHQNGSNWRGRHSSTFVDDGTFPRESSTLSLFPRPAREPASRLQHLLRPSNVEAKSFEFGEFPGKSAKPLIEWLDRSGLPFIFTPHFISKIKITGKSNKFYSRNQRRQTASLFNLYVEHEMVARCCAKRAAAGTRRSRAGDLKRNHGRRAE